MRISSGILLALLLFSVFQCFAQSNPFLSGNSTTEPRSEPETIHHHTPYSLPVIGSLIAKSTATQRTLQRSIAEMMTEVNETGNMKNFWILLGISFVFGILHAIGPGHRKTVLVAYFIGEESSPLKGILTGFLLAAVHAASAILLVGGFYLFTTRSLLVSVDTAQNFLFPLTYGIILLLGIWMVFQGFKDYRSEKYSRNSRTGMGGLVLSGLLPCPAASAIMIMAIAGNAAKIGILSIISMSLGMGMLLASVGLLTILMRNRMTALLQNSAKGKKFEFTLQLISGLAIALFALFMIIGSIQL